MRSATFNPSIINALFGLWVEILDETLDGGWNGPMTESA